MEEVTFIDSKEQFVVHYHGEKSMVEEMKKAVEAVIIAPGARKALGEIGSTKIIKRP